MSFNLHLDPGYGPVGFRHGLRSARPAEDLLRRRGYREGFFRGVLVRHLFLVVWLIALSLLATGIGAMLAELLLA